MINQRRNFIRKMSGLAGASLLAPVINPLAAKAAHASLSQIRHASPEVAARDEDFWFQVRQAYTSSPNLINLNNGGVSPQPRSIQDAQDRYTRFSNEAPGYYMWRVLGRLRAQVRRQLAILGGCSPDELAIMRNTTEALETVIFGIDLKRGDAILTTDQDYPSMLSALAQRNRREGIVINKISLPVPATDMAEIVSRFEAAITPKTKVILVCHMINITGQILPVKEICTMARKRGIQVIVDGAHTFAQLDFRIPDLGCDYFGTSLHKWLCAPFGTGMLYVRPDRIESLWPLFGHPEGEEKKITKFEHLGTRSFPAELAVAEAISFHQGIGIARKEARLRFLKDYWAEKIRDIRGVTLNTSLDPAHSCGIANVSIEGKQPGPLCNELINTYGIYTSPVNHADVKGLRITPHVYTSLTELDYLVEVIEKVAKEAQR